MKKLIMLLLAIPVMANVSMAKNLKAKLAHATFNAPGQGPYIETYLSVAGNSVVFAPVKEGKYQASIEVTIVLSNSEGIKHFDKYNLLSPEAQDTLQTFFNFLDQQRIQLPNGKYKFELTIKDKNQDVKPFTVVQDVSIDYHPTIISISDIELLQSFKPSADNNKLAKGGYELVPFVDNYFPDEINSLKFYTEIYNTSTVLNNDGYVLSYFIKSFESNVVLNNFTRLQRMQSKEVNALIKEVDITDLPSGNYNLVVEARNRNNELLASREIFFQRSRTLNTAESGLHYKQNDISNTFVASITNKDTLSDYIQSIRPISGSTTNNFADNQLDLNNLEMMQQFFYNFWEDKNKSNPYQAWMNYKAEVDKVNEKFSTPNKRGYDTDRGRVYLQYGAPNHLSENYFEPSAYPHEIWHYYKLGNQTNRRFVFYNPDLVSNDFELIHSDALGEVNNQQWQLRVNSRTETNNDHDRKNSRDHFGKKSDDFYKNTR